MVRALELCGNLRRVHILLLHSDVKTALFAALRKSISLQVVVWAAPISPSGVRLRGNEALLLPSDDFIATSALWCELVFLALPEMAKIFLRILTS